MEKTCLKTRNHLTPNDILVEGSIGKILLYYRNGTKRAETIVDSDDVPRVSAHKWCYSGGKSVTVRTVIDGKTVYLHRFLMGNPLGMEIDHINRERLDNRMANLRIVTSGENNRNRKFKGYHLHKQKECAPRWRVVVHKDRKTVYEKQFETEEEAAIATREQRLIHHGEFACVEE